MGEPVNQDIILGELRGQVRELVHSVNNISGKMDALTREVIALGPLAADLAELKGRVYVIETTLSRQAGATGIITAILKSPAVGWVIGAAGMVWMLLTGGPSPK